MWRSILFEVEIVDQQIYIQVCEKNVWSMFLLYRKRFKVNQKVLTELIKEFTH